MGYNGFLPVTNQKTETQKSVGIYLDDACVSVADTFKL